MARGERVTVELSTQDRALINKLVKALKGSGAFSGVVQLDGATIEKMVRNIPDSISVYCGNGSSDEELFATLKGDQDDKRRLVEIYSEENYQWDGSGWVPKPPAVPATPAVQTFAERKRGVN